MNKKGKILQAVNDEFSERNMGSGSGFNCGLRHLQSMRKYSWLYNLSRINPE